MNSENSIDWTFVQVIIEIIDTLIVIIPALIGFIYYTFKKINIIINNEQNGSLVIIHNISKNTIFLNKIAVVCKQGNKKVLLKNKDFNLSEIVEIAPDKTLKIKIDYTLLNISISKKKKVIITVNNRLKYRKRIEKDVD